MSATNSSNEVSISRRAEENDINREGRVGEEGVVVDAAAATAGTAPAKTTGAAAAITVTTTRNNNNNAAAPTRSSTITTTTVTSPRVYIGNLHARVTQVHLESLLTARSLAVERIAFISSSSGSNVSSAPTHHRQQNNNNHKSNNNKPGSSGQHHYAFVTFPSTADAARAIQLLHGRQLMGRPLVVQPARPKPTDGGSIAAGGSANSNATKRNVEDQIRAIQQKLKHATHK